MLDEPDQETQDLRVWIAQDRYLNGQIDLDEFEAQIEKALTSRSPLDLGNPEQR